MRGCRTLGDISRRLSSLEVQCSRCRRRGRLAIARLLAEHSGDLPMPDLRRKLCKHCPQHGAPLHQRCDVLFPQLLTL